MLSGQWELQKKKTVVFSYNAYENAIWKLYDVKSSIIESLGQTST